MAKCKRCGKFGLFMSVNKIGLCPRCQNEYNAYIAREAEIFGDSSKIVTETDNLSTRLSRCDLALQKLFMMKNFGNEDYDLFWEITKSSRIDEMIDLYAGMADDLREMYSGIESLIFDLIQEHGSVPKKLIVDTIQNAQQETGRNLPFNIDKSVVSILKDLEFDQKLRKEKIKNRYEYFLNDAAAG